MSSVRSSQEGKQSFRRHFTAERSANNRAGTSVGSLFNLFMPEYSTHFERESDQGGEQWYSSLNTPPPPNPVSSLKSFISH